MSFLTPSTQNQILPIFGDTYDLEVSPICAMYSELPLLEMNVQASVNELDTYEWDPEENPMLRVAVLDLYNNDDLVAANTSNYSCSALSIWGKKTLTYTLNMIIGSKGKVSFVKVVLYNGHSCLQF